jgi:hypothetical protein
MVHAASERFSPEIRLTTFSVLPVCFQQFRVIHTCSLEDIMYGVIIFSEDYSDDAAAAFVVAADVPIVWERWFTREELDSDPETSWMSEGTWTSIRPISVFTISD